MVISAWVVRTKNLTYGPYSSAEEAGMFLKGHLNNMVPPFAIIPVMVPLGEEYRDVMPFEPTDTV